jgi:hypothetical protein
MATYQLDLSFLQMLPYVLAERRNALGYRTMSHLRAPLYLSSTASRFTYSQIFIQGCNLSSSGFEQNLLSIRIDMRGATLRNPPLRLAAIFSYAFLWLLLLSLIDAATIHDCDKAAFTINLDNAQSSANFSVAAFIAVGSCTRQGSAGDCYATLINTLTNVNPLRQVEYSGAATVLTLLPTIGALFGAPTTEIWTMLMIIPFGGWIALLVSFGGTMMPVKVEDYELANAKESSIVIRDGKESKLEVGERIQRRQSVLRKIRARLSQQKGDKIPKRLLASGLLFMTALLIGAQAAMAIVEQGAVLQWWCSCNWWMHLWYLLSQSDHKEFCLKKKLTNLY